MSRFFLCDAQIHAPRMPGRPDATTTECSFGRETLDREMFTEALPFFSDEDRHWIMGRGICEWIGWPITATR